MINDNIVFVHKEEYEILTHDSLLTNLTRKFLRECKLDSDYKNISLLRFIYDIPSTKEKEDT